ncbi:hypothetical protein QL285_005528 [Trifolium repens]|nr:hypothetical protein QL285_005528 [Trifolium repens]
MSNQQQTFHPFPPISIEQNLCNNTKRSSGIIKISYQMATAKEQVAKRCTSNSGKSGHQQHIGSLPSSNTPRIAKFRLVGKRP